MLGSFGMLADDDEHQQPGWIRCLLSDLPNLLQTDDRKRRLLVSPREGGEHVDAA